ncbi:Ltp family lipoprotein [Viridibacillus sp. YIM B01967]|uniref:Ltp family lipoprotein n=2 Tax=Viridibacillus soli TaxID=2798301 RepID=A0ABS1HA48_9BACL|nr:Ltp family lipoprotein [Viridibacillus soli]
MILLLVSMLALPVFVIMSVISFVKKDGLKGKKMLKFSGISFAAIIVTAIGVGATAEPTETSNKDKEKVETVAKVEEKVEETPEEKAAREAKAAEEKALAEQKAKEKAKAKAKEESVPREYKSALKKAESYAKTMHMSKEGIYDQLTSEYGENFPVEAAQYAIDNIVFDWKDNALKKAQTYAETMSMSDSAIYDQLISKHGEKFTTEEAQYAIDNLE